MQKCKTCGGTVETTFYFECATCFSKRLAPKNMIVRQPSQKDIEVIKNILLDYQWHTLEELNRRSGIPEATISARIRELKRIFNIEKRQIKNGKWEYRIAR